MAMRNHLPIALIATGVVTLCVLLLCVLSPSGSQDTVVRTKRSLPSQNFVFHNGVHRIHWTRKHGLKSKGSPVNDVFISVKTTEKFHQKRLEPILNTWFQLAKSQVIKDFVMLPAALNAFLCWTTSRPYACCEAVNHSSVITKNNLLRPLVEIIGTHFFLEG